MQAEGYCCVTNELIDDQWHFPRQELGKSYLEMLTKGAGDQIALQWPLRWGSAAPP